MSINLFKLFWWVYLVEFITPVVLIVHYLTGYEFNFLVKIASIIYYILIIVFHVKNKIFINPILLLFLIFGLFSFFYGIWINNEIDGKFVSHLYFSTIPILGTSFGYHFAKKFNQDLKSFFLRIINISFFVTCVLLIVYFYLHFITGSIAYWGFGSEMHVLIPFMISQARFSTVILGIVFVILSGKRATILNVGLGVIIFFSNLLKSISIRTLPRFIFLIILLGGASVFANYQGAFSRFEQTFSYDFNDDDLMYMATSGRWQEVTGILEHHNSKPYGWLFGSGFGGRYEWFIEYENYSELKHYAHFSPFAYIFVFGLPFTVLLYTIFINYVRKSLPFSKNPFVIVFIIGIFSSFFGANLLVDIKLWFFSGVVIFIIKNPKSEIARF
jgi:hypothetical protein